MMEFLLLLTALAGATYASYSDLKYGIIPNRLAFSLILLGIGSYTVYSVYFKNYQLLFLVIKNFALIFVIGYLFWILGGWSAGDAKELMFLAALVPKYPEPLKQLFNPTLAPYPFSITMLLNTLLLIFPFIALYSLLLTCPIDGFRRIIKPVLEYRASVQGAIVLLASYLIGDLLNSRAVIVIVLLLLMIIKNPKIKTMAAGAGVGGSLLISGNYIPAAKAFILFTILIVTTRFFFNLLRLLLKEGLRREIRITELEEGMILAEEIYREKDSVRRDTRSKLERIIDGLRTGKKEERDIIVRSGAAGVTGKEIKLLKELVERGELEDRVLVTRGISFAPAILAGFIASITAGDLVFYLRGIIG